MRFLNLGAKFLCAHRSMNLLRLVVEPPKLHSAKLRNLSKMSGHEEFPYKVDKEELRKRLTPIQFEVTQEKGTERPFTGEYTKLKDDGSFACIVCDKELFRSEAKFDSGCGWPSFSDVVSQGHIKVVEDNSLGMKRMEVMCANCGAHMGHVFDDGPKHLTGLRYCINSASIKFTGKSK